MLRELTPSSQHRADVIKMQTVLKSLVVFGSSMDRFLYLLIPTLIRVIEMPIFVTTMRQNALTTMTSASRNVTSSGLVVSSREQSDKVKHAAIRALGKLAQELDFSDYASRIIHSLTRVVQRATATNLSLLLILILLIVSKSLPEQQQHGNESYRYAKRVLFPSVFHILRVWNAFASKSNCSEFRQ